MTDEQWLADEFEQHRAHLHAVAYRMLGSHAEADDAVQDAWLRVSRAGARDVDNLGGWLTTVVARVCLNALRSRTRRREEPLDFHVPDPVVTVEPGASPDDAAVLADSVTLALLVVLDTLTPPERLAFVLHDLFDVPYDQIGELVDRSPDATRQLTSRARRRVQSAPTTGSEDRARCRTVVNAFFDAARGGDIAALVRLLHPDAVLRIDAGDQRDALSMALHGAGAVAQQTTRGIASMLNRPDVHLEPRLVNGLPGVVAWAHDRPISVIGFLFADGRITQIDAVADPVRVRSIVDATTASGEPGRSDLV